MRFSEGMLGGAMDMAPAIVGRKVLGLNFFLGGGDGSLDCSCGVLVLVVLSCCSVDVDGMIDVCSVLVSGSRNMDMDMDALGDLEVGSLRVSGSFRRFNRDSPDADADPDADGGLFMLRVGSIIFAGVAVVVVVCVFVCVFVCVLLGDAAIGIGIGTATAIGMGTAVMVCSVALEVLCCFC